MATESNPNPTPTPSGFFTPMRIVTVCALAAIGVGIWLSSSRTSQQPNQSNSAPTRAGQTTPAAPNVAAPNAAPPVVASVPLAESIRETKVKTIDGGSLKLADFKNKVVVVNLWATWCGPCRMEVPEYEQVRKDYEGRGVEFIALTIEDPRIAKERVKQFVRDFNFGFRLGWADRETALTLTQGRTTIPQTLVIALDGHILSQADTGHGRTS